MATKKLNTIFQLKRANAAEWPNNYVLAAGEPGFELDTGKLKIGDDVTPWSNLNYINTSNINTNNNNSSAPANSNGKVTINFTTTTTMETVVTFTVPTMSMGTTIGTGSFPSSGDDRIFVGTNLTNLYLDGKPLTHDEGGHYYYNCTFTTGNYTPTDPNEPAFMLGFIEDEDQYRLWYINSYGNYSGRTMILSRAVPDISNLITTSTDIEILAAYNNNKIVAATVDIFPLTEFNLISGTNPIIVFANTDNTNINYSYISGNTTMGWALSSTSLAAIPTPITEEFIIEGTLSIDYKGDFSISNLNKTATEVAAAYEANKDIRLILTKENEEYNKYKVQLSFGHHYRAFGDFNGSLELVGIFNYNGTEYLLRAYIGNGDNDSISARIDRKLLGLVSDYQFNITEENNELVDSIPQSL